MQQENIYKIDKVETFKDDLKYDTVYYAKLSALVIANMSVMEVMSSRVPDNHIKLIAYVITSFAGVSIFNITLLKSFKSYMDYLKLNNLLINNRYDDKTKDLLIKLHLEDTDEVEKERNLC